jgi:citrate lyase beta subunit
MARRAVEDGTAPVGRMLDRLGLSATDLARTLGLPVEPVEAMLLKPCRSPVVVLDGEDAVAPSEEARSHAVRIAADTLLDADWGQSLRFYRSPSLDGDTAVRNLYQLLWRLRERNPGPSLPLDAIVIPKIEHPEEVDLVNDVLERAEAALGLPDTSIRVAYLVESGWAVAQLSEIAQRAAPRLASLIFGVADFSADVGLSTIDMEHPVVDWARAEIVTVAGAVGVPSVDGMTLAYPVIDSTLDARRQRTNWLAQMRIAYDDTVRARHLGMLGKWVGNPAQLLAVLLAFETSTNGVDIEREAEKLAEYEAAVTAGQGATMIAGLMGDRATDRQSRAVLRQAAALGRLDLDRAVRLRVITEAERAEASQQWPPFDKGGPR